MSHHVFGRDALGGIFVVSATRGMDVMVPGEPALGCHMDPAFELDAHRLGGLFLRDGEIEFCRKVLRTTRGGHGVLAGRQYDRLAIGPIDLWVEEEVGCKSASWVGVDPTFGVLDQDRTGCFFAVMIADFKANGLAGNGAKQDRCFASESQVLGSLSDIEGQGGFEGAWVAAVELDDAVFDLES